MKQAIKNSYAVYECPAAKVMKIENEGILCASSELQELKKESFDFEWGN